MYKMQLKIKLNKVNSPLEYWHDFFFSFFLYFPLHQNLRPHFPPLDRHPHHLHLWSPLPLFLENLEIKNSTLLIKYLQIDCNYCMKKVNFC